MEEKKIVAQISKGDEDFHDAIITISQSEDMLEHVMIVIDDFAVRINKTELNRAIDETIPVEEVA